MGYLADGEVGPSSGGRAPRTLRFRGERGRILVFALGALHIRVGIADLEGDIQDHLHEDWDITVGPMRTLERAAALLDRLLARHEAVPTWAVAVGIPGPVDFQGGRPVAPPIMPGWNGFDVRALFEERYGAPVWVDNDVNLLTLGGAREDREGRSRSHLLQGRHRRGCRAALAGPDPSRSERRRR